MGWLALGYLLLAHMAAVIGEPRLQWLAIVWLLATALWRPLVLRRLWSWGAFVVGAALAWPLAHAGGALYALYLPPVVIPIALLVVFGSSLRPGELPLITRIATVMRGGSMPDELRSYTRRVTQLWCCVFVLLGASGVACALWATPAAWSLMTNFVHYIVIGAVFVIEFLYRRVRYRRYEQDGLFSYLRRLAHVRIHD